MSNAERFVGMPKKQAQNEAEKANLIFRLVSVNGDIYFGEPDDEVADRLCVEIIDGKVCKAYFK
jgi:hypothetical protein